MSTTRACRPRTYPKVFRTLHYGKIAAILRDFRPEPNRDPESRTRLDQWIETVRHFEIELSLDNPAFDRAKFREDCTH